MNIIKASIIVDGEFGLSGKYNYVRLNNFDDIKKYKNIKYNCILVKYLRPEFTILLPSIDLIITENGGAMAHLAIMAMSEGKSVLLANESLKMFKKGKLEIKNTKNNYEIIIKIK